MGLPFKINCFALILICILGAGCESNHSIPQVTHGRLERIDDLQSKYVGQRIVDVWLPEPLDSKGNYSVVYMHDGQMLFDPSTTWNNQAWEVDSIAQHLIDSGRVHPFIVVAIHNRSSVRHSNYFPQKPFESLSQKVQDSLYSLYRNTDTPLFGKSVNSDDYLKYLVEELIPRIEKQYPVGKGPENRFIAGSSMGGLISWYALSEYPNVFSGAACLSTHWPGVFSNERNPIPGAFLEYLDKVLPSSLTHAFYFDHGTATLDSLYSVHQQVVDSLFYAKGFTNQRYKSEVFQGANHSEEAWSTRIGDALEFLLNTPTQSMEHQ